MPVRRSLRSTAASCGLAERHVPFPSMTRGARFSLLLSLSGFRAFTPLSEIRAAPSQLHRWGLAHIALDFWAHRRCTDRWTVSAGESGGARRGRHSRASLTSSRGFALRAGHPLSSLLVPHKHLRVGRAPERRSSAELRVWESVVAARGSCSERVTHCEACIRHALAHDVRALHCSSCCRHVCRNVFSPRGQVIWEVCLALLGTGVTLGAMVVAAQSVAFSGWVFVVL